jgi:tetratricopeptide (TPR) repeat protein
VRDVIRRHLLPLPPAARELLSLAAVIGLEFDLSTLEAASGQPALALLEGLAEAVQLDVIAELRDEAQRWRFAHALIPETLYADLPPSRRAQAHRQVAEALERVHADAPEPPATELAHHWFRAVPLGGAGRALEWSERAGRAAYAGLAWDEAARHARRALQALSACPPDEPRRLELLLLLGAAEGCAAQIEPAREAYEEALRLAETLGQPDAVGRAALEYGRLEIGMVPNPRVVELLERADRALPAEPSRLRCAVLAELANALIFSDESERREELARRAVAMARAFGDPSALVAALLADHFVRWGPDGDPREMLAMMEEAIALLPQVTDRRLHLEIRRWRMRDLLELGERAGAEQEAARIGRLVGEWRLQSTAVYSRLARGGLALLAGRLDEAARAADVELEPFLKDPFSTIRNSIEGLRLALRLEQDDLEVYRAAADQLDGLARAVPMWRGPLAVVFHELGEVGRARGLLDAAEAGGFADLRRDGTWFTSIGMFALVAPRLGSRRACARLYELLRPHAHRHVVFGVAIGGQGSIERHLGGLAEALGDFEGAVLHLERALAANEDAALRVPTAFTRLALARALARRGAPGDVERAAELRGEARREAESLGLRRLLRHLDEAEAEGVFASAAREPEATPRAAADAPPISGVAVLRQKGDTWLVAHGESSFHLKDAKGLVYLARLLAEPGRELHVLDLVGGPGAAPGRGGAAAEAGLSAGEGGDAGELLDAQARAAYRERLGDLREELAEAERFGDGERAARAQEELDFLAQELARATGLGGRARRAGAAAERARVNATRAIGAVLRKIAATDPILGEHLTATVRTGLFCSYQPGAGRGLRWEL